MNLLRNIISSRIVYILIILICFSCGDIFAESKFNVEVKDFFNTLPYKTCIWKVTINQNFSTYDKSFISVRKDFGVNKSHSQVEYLTLASIIYINDTSYFYYIPYQENNLGPLILTAPDKKEYYGTETNQPIVSTLSDSLSLDSAIKEYSQVFTIYRELMEKEKKYKKRLGNEVVAPIIIGLATIGGIVYNDKWEAVNTIELTLGVSVIVNYIYNFIGHKKRESKLKTITHQLNNWNTD
jgi:hypothetical protein